MSNICSHSLTVAPGSCDLCLSEDWDPQLGVQNYPRKPVKKAPRVEQTLTCIVERERAGEEMEYLLTQRPSKGETIVLTG